MTFSVRHARPPPPPLASGCSSATIVHTIETLCEVLTALFFALRERHEIHRLQELCGDVRTESPAADHDRTPFASLAAGEELVDLVQML